MKADSQASSITLRAPAPAPAPIVEAMHQLRNDPVLIEGNDGKVKNVFFHETLYFLFLIRRPISHSGLVALGHS